LPAANVQDTKEQIIEQFEFDEKEIMYISAKEGKNVESVLEQIVLRIPSPKIDTKKDLPMTAFLFDARFVHSRGVACLVKIMSGTFNLEKMRNLMSYHSYKRYDVFEVGVV